MAQDEPRSATLRLLRPPDPARDHLRGVRSADAVVVVAYEDFLCPYCRRLRLVLRRLREALGDRLVYVFRHYPNERAHPGADLAARAAEAAAAQGRFYEMHDSLFDHEPPIGAADIDGFARAIGLDVDRFARDLASDGVRAHVDEDLAEARRNGVTETPTLFIDGVRYDGAWDYHSLLEALERPVAARVHRSARVFASLPTSAGLVLLVATALALACANTPVGPLYERLMETRFVVGPAGGPLSLSAREWLSEGLLTVFFLLVGLEIRREMTTGALADRRAAALPIVAAAGGVVTPALVYLALNRGATSRGWAIPTATDVAFSLALLAVLGDRVPSGLRVFVAALAVVDDVLSVAVLAIVTPRAFAPGYALAVAGALLVLFAFRRARVYAIWPYLAAGLALWGSLHALGVHGALAGVLLAMSFPSLPAPAVAPLLAQAATALDALDHAQREARPEGQRREDRAEHDAPEAPRLGYEPVWEWAARNLSAATARLVSPAERIERAVAPWSAYLILPAFAFSATGVRVTADFSSADAGRVFAGVLVALVIGKPLGVLVASGLAVTARVAIAPEGVGARQFIGGACLCGVADTVALLTADRVLPPGDAAIAKLAVLAGTAVAGALGALVLATRRSAATPAG